jgi:hypothetical protein
MNEILIRKKKKKTTLGGQKSIEKASVLFSRGQITRLDRELFGDN